MGYLLAGWIWLCLVVFTLGCLLRAFKYATAPVHLRWDLYPVAHEPGRDHGGSYLEKMEWWKTKREKSHFAEVFAMVEEIFLLKGVWENNRRLWRASLPFHWGLYTLVLTTVGLAVTSVGFQNPVTTGLLSITGVLGGGLLCLGALWLFMMRSTDPKLRPYTSPLDRINLLILALFGGLTVAVVAGQPGLHVVQSDLGALLVLRAETVPFVWAIQMAVGALFLLYLPLTNMVHFFAKYFTYHQVRWDDQPITENQRKANRIKGALGYGVDWSAGHIRTGATWGELATTMPEEHEEKE